MTDITEYFLRTTDKDGKAYGGFQWPMQVGAIVEAPDWNPRAECGGGLHGLKGGLGESSHLSGAADAVWWIVEAADAVDLDGKHKFHRCEVVALGDRATVTAALYALRPGPIHYLVMTGGDYATLTGGYRATLTGGDYATLIFLRWIDGRRRVLTAYVGEGGIEAGKAYRGNDRFDAVVPA